VRATRRGRAQHGLGRRWQSPGWKRLEVGNDMWDPAVSECWVEAARDGGSLLGQLGYAELGCCTKGKRAAAACCYYCTARAGCGLLGWIEEGICSLGIRGLGI
jgi:hypothetical protein